MDHDVARSILADKHRAVLATHRRDGSLQMSPVTVALDGEGRPVISSRQTAYKVKNLRRDPQASLCVFTDAFFGQWVQVDGTATIVDLPEAMER
jgi:PPOX class probable F420-dependent enzyme